MHIAQLARVRHGSLITGMVAIALLVLACSGGDDGEDEATTAPTSTATAAMTETASSTSGSGTSGSGGALLTSQACQDAAVAWASALQASAAGITGITETQVQQLEDALDAAADDAPREIRADLEVFGAAWTEFITAIEDSGWTPTSGTVPPAALLAAMEAFNDDEVIAAGERITAWFEGNCEG